MKKENWILLLLLVLRFFIAYSLDSSDAWLTIDCGSDKVRVGGDLVFWETDDFVTQTGVNARINSTTQVPEEMKTLRFFPDAAQKNCYGLPISMEARKYLIRAGFYYGNYDGLSSPPTFDLYFNDKKWSTVDTSTIEGPLYHEAVYTTKSTSGWLTICLVQTKEGDIPFISSIEVVPLPSDLYSHLEDAYGFNLVSRTNLGGDEVRHTGLPTDDLYDRVWTRGEVPSNCVEVLSLPDLSLTVENEPPFNVMADSIQSRTATDPIILSIDLPQGTPQPQSAYFVLYFNEIASLPAVSSRTIDISIDGQKKTTVTTAAEKCKVVQINAVATVGPTINVTLGTTTGSSLPAIVSAMEVFIRGQYYADETQDHGKSFSSITRDHFLSPYALLIYCLWFMFIN